MSHRTRKSDCLGCGKSLDGAVQTTGNAKPKPGDITVCLYCGTTMKFGSKMKLQHLTDAERVEVESNPEVAKIQSMIRTLIKNRSN